LRDRVTGRWRRLPNEKLYDLYFSPITFPVIKSRKIRWAGQAGRMGGKTTFIKGFGGKTYGKHCLKDLSIEEIIILKWIFKNYSGSTDCIDLAQDTDRRRTLVNAVMNFQVPKKGKIFFTS
jgi:hypothetical protein